jgi:hypothetical protein
VGRILGIGFIVVGIWVGLEVYTEGVAGAFGGLFERLAPASAFEAPAERSTPDRAVDAFQRAYDQSEGRVDRALAGER